MGDYEKEMRRLQALWMEVQSENEELIESYGEKETNSVSINSDYPDIEQEASYCKDGQEDNLAEVAGAIANTEENDVIENLSEIMQDRYKYYVGKNGTRWRKNCYKQRKCENPK